MKTMDRRRVLGAAACLGGGLAAANFWPAWAQTTSPGAQAPPTLSGQDLKLVIERRPVTIDGRPGGAVLINGTMPGPLLRLKEGQSARIAVENRMDEETSLHWHGVLTPVQMDGVPGVSFPGIPPHSTFVYEFTVIQNGTYWYHSHSGFQEMEGMFAPIIIEPKGSDPVAYDREHVIMLSDYSFTPPARILAKLKQDSGVFNYQRQTIAGLFSGKDQTLAERVEWSKMLMDPTDIADVTGAAFTYPMNGHGPNAPWTGLFKPDERVRLRFVAAGAMTIFNVRIPGLKLTVVASDGQNVRPVVVDEFQIANGETYDVIVQPSEDRAYAIVAETVDRSGMARGVLAPRTGMTAEFPPLRPRPIDTLRDMGMDMSAMQKGSQPVGASMAGMAMPAPATAQVLPGMAQPKPRGSDVMGDMGGMRMSMRDPLNAPQVKLGPGVEMIAPMPQDRTGEPGQGLESVGHRVLVYKDLAALEPNPDQRAPGRTVEIHLTGNMERFMWSLDGERYSDTTKPLMFRSGERVRVTLVNDTMMSHPMHLHGHFVELAHGPEGHRPRKHTVNVMPAGKVSWDFTPAAGDWAFHCHMFLHMAVGMFQVFAVRPLDEKAI
ncbi:copper resistance system multicopper oxidase [Phenylobacterium montanum]|uniref:Copper resistance system multicopper oxidase n=1 Tax=Phenylobacterium montanum TaxID=2823693 RepID=A0A975G4Q9_9CAUL|nr:copper resistance system multicopper oxidase [Caulobacter sp. S6]QUD90534.1 copper resistance system multicopper oxidase [Caulobacter sp. S6]